MDSLSEGDTPRNSGNKLIICLKQRKGIKIDYSDVEEIFEETTRRHDIDVEA